MSRFIKFLASGFGAGYAPQAPGTAGSVVGLGLAFVLQWASGGNWLLYLIITVFLSLLAVPVSTKAERLYGKKDCPKIVIDEIAGILVTFLVVPLTWYTALIGFMLFRLFDIWKPFPARLLQDRLPGGWGVVGDDVMAGIYANIVLQALTRFCGL